MLQQIRSSEEVRAWFDRHGVTVAQWAKAYCFAPSVVYSVLSGRCTGRRGQAHQVAVALGLRPGAEPGEQSPLPIGQPVVGAGLKESPPGDPPDAFHHKEVTMT
jgi:gp16 family phage-associated protein